jgi:hypothetical protein
MRILVFFVLFILNLCICFCSDSFGYTLEDIEKVEKRALDNRLAIKNGMSGFLLNVFCTKRMVLLTILWIIFFL